MKKILSFVLVLAMVLGSVSMVFANTFTDVADDANYLEAVEVLSALGVVNGTTATTFNPTGNLTRAQALAFVIRALGIKVTEGAAYETGFSDVASDYKLAGYIYWGVTLGITNGYADGTFRPQDPVSTDQMTAFALRAVGYDDDTKVKGGYPAGYNLIALKGNLYDETEVLAGTAKATRANAAEIIYWAIKQPKAVYNANYSAYVAENEDDTLIADLGGNASETMVVDTDAVLANISKIDLTKYLGRTVKVVKDSEGAVIAAFSPVEPLLTGVKKTSDGKWTIGGKEVTMTSSSSITCYTNLLTSASVALSTHLTEDCTGAFVVELSAGKIATVSSVQEWTASDTVAVTAADAKTFGTTDAAINNCEFVKTEDGKVATSLIVVNGASKLTDIKAGDLVTYYLADGEIVRVDVSTKTVTGLIDRYNATKGTVVINGTTYDLATGAYAAEDTATLAAGKVASTNASADDVYYLNAEGELAGLKAGTEAETDDTYYYGIFLQEYAGTAATSTLSTATTAENAGARLVINKDGVATETKIYYDTTTTKGGFSAGDFVYYQLNADGEIATLAAVTTEAAPTGTAIEGYAVSKNGFATKSGSDSYAFNSDSALFYTAKTSAADLAKAASWSIISAKDVVSKTLTGSSIVMTKDGYVTIGKVDYVTTTETTTEFFAITSVETVGKTLYDAQYEYELLNLNTGLTVKKYSDGFVDVDGAVYTITTGDKGVITTFTAVSDGAFTVVATLAKDDTLKLNGEILSWYDVSEKTTETVYELAADAAVYKYDSTKKTWTKISLDGFKAAADNTKIIANEKGTIILVSVVDAQE